MSVLLSPGRPGEGDPVGVVEQPIADGVGHGSVSKLVMPVLDGGLAGEDGGAVP